MNRLRIATILTAVSVFAQTARFPATVATDSDLKISKNFVSTRLVGSVAAGDTLWTVRDASRIEANMLLTCDQEIVSVTAVSGNNITVSRGFDNTTAASHRNGADVRQYPTAWDVNALREEVKAIEAALGTNLTNIPTRISLHDIRLDGATCDGTDQNAAVQAALAAGHTKLFFPAGCKWIPPVNAGVGLNYVPGGLHIIGENWETTKIWPTSAAVFLAIGPKTRLENVNLNGPLCSRQVEGCPVGVYVNNNSSNNVPVQNYPYNQIFGDTGSTDNVSGGYDTNDNNVIAVIQRGQGGGIYGQYNGGVGASSGSGIHAQQSYTSGYGLLVTRTSTGSGQTWWDQTGAETGTTAAFTSGVKTGGSFLSMYHSTSNWASAKGLHMNFGDSGGSFSGYFLQMQIAGTDRFSVSDKGKTSATNLLINNDLHPAPLESTDAAISTSTRTTGDLLTLYHSTSALNGNAIYMNLADSGGSFGGNFMQAKNAGTIRFNVDYGGRVQIGSTTLAGLGTPPNGTEMYCEDCNAASTPCTSGGTGAWAFRVAGAWKCPF